jgi:hypothetical protein
MWKVSPSPLVKRKSSSIFPSLPRHLIFILCVAICPQAHSGQANVAYLAGGCFWCTEAVFQEAPRVTSVVSGTGAKIIFKTDRNRDYSSGIISSGARKPPELLPEKPEQSVRPTNHRAEASKARPQESLSQ